MGEESSSKLVKCTECNFLGKRGPHWGCFAGGKWQKWIPKDEIDTPRECSDHQLKWRPPKGPKFDLRVLYDLTLKQAQIEKKVPKFLSPQLTNQLVVGKGLIEETLEYLNALGTKPWRPNPLPPEKQLEELVDILHFYLALVIYSDFNWKQIVEEYDRKHDINLRRYEAGARGDYSWDTRSEKEEL